MQSKFNIIIVVLLVFNLFFSFYSFSKNNNSFENIAKQKKIDDENFLKNLKVYNEKLKKENPYIFLDSKEIQKYDCNSIKIEKDKNECNAKKYSSLITSLFKGLTNEQIIKYDCSKIEDSELKKRCETYNKIKLKKGFTGSLIGD